MADQGRKEAPSDGPAVVTSVAQSESIHRSSSKSSSRFSTEKPAKSSVEDKENTHIQVSEDLLESQHVEDPDFKHRAKDFFMRMPKAAIGCLGAYIALTLGAILLARFANGHPVKSFNYSAFQGASNSTAKWKIVGHGIIQPSIWISVLASCAHIVIVYALAQGAAVMWWHKALRGATLQQLHRYFANGSVGSSVLTSFAHPRHFNYLAFATIVSTISLTGGGALLQKGSTTSGGNPLPDRVAQVPFIRDWSTVDTGTYVENNVLALQGSVFQALQEVQNQENKNVFGAFVPNNTEAGMTVSILGFGFDCKTTRNDSVIFGPSNTSSTNVFSIQFGSGTTAKNFSAIALNVTFFQNPNIYSLPDGPAPCTNYMVSKECLLVPGVLNASIYNSNLRQGAGDGNSNDDVYVSTGWVFDDTSINSTSPTSSFTGSTITGLQDMLSQTDFHENQPLAGQTARLAGLIETFNIQYGASANVSRKTFSNESGWAIETHGQLAYYEHLGTSDPFLPDNATQGCPFAYDDPLSDINNNIAALMFKLSLPADGAAHNNENLDGSVPAYLKLQEVVLARYDWGLYYRYDWQFLLGAGLLSLFTVCIVAWTLRGFWSLNRKVSLSPIETAKAFNAPVLENVDSGNHYVENILEVAGTRNVKYDANGQSVGMGEVDSVDSVKAEKSKKWKLF